jgi:hypothetical protein
MIWLHWDDICNWNVGSHWNICRPLCPVPPEFAAIYCHWLQARSHKDSALVCGIAADWLEDHRSELLAGPVNVSVRRLDDFVAYLRYRFRQQFEHST